MIRTHFATRSTRRNEMETNTAGISYSVANLPQESIEDAPSGASTPSLWKTDAGVAAVGTDTDDDSNDDTNAVEYLTDCMESLTSDQTDEMLQGFELYVQNHHNLTTATCCPSEPVVTDPSSSSSSNNNSSNNSSNNSPSRASSLRKWLRCRSTPAPVDGISLKRGFEPNLRTLDGIRTNLFFGGDDDSDADENKDPRLWHGPKAAKRLR